jgi:MoaA/NifB/PqqE/SkfB family radical SAM enzyme
MKFELKKNNLLVLSSLPRLAKESGARCLDILNSRTKDDLACFCESLPLILPILDWEEDFEVWLHDMPYCLFGPNCHDHILVKTEGEKTEVCKSCKFYKICSGFPKGYFDKYGEEEVKPMIDKPMEVMIEAETKCNFLCKFCFNKLSFAKKGRELLGLSSENIKEIIKNISESGIKIVRFTGGEPLLRKDILELMQFARDLNLQVWLNTNASLIDENLACKLVPLVDNFLIPIESYDNDKEGEITGHKNSLNKKIAALKNLEKAGAKKVRVGTVAIPENIEEFSQLSDFVLSLPIDEWEFYWPVGEKCDKKLLEKLTDNIIKLRSKTDKFITIANSVPFCVIDEPAKLNLVCRGAVFENGHSRLVIDPRGFVKPHYFLDKNIGEPCDIMSAWNCEDMLALRNLELLPEKCQECRFKFKCRGGRF